MNKLHKSGILFHLPSQTFKFITGYSNWKHIHEDAVSHENSSRHRNAYMLMINRVTNSVIKIKASLDNQLENEKLYWFKVIEGVINVIKYLVSRGLPLRGDNQDLGSTRN